ncbi:MAG TPA: tyrosine-type recombinase/integrase [Bacteroidia bacterium]|nr:tyrosine-type recombinase/integrase [Bacteroidia bacterium]
MNINFYLRDLKQEKGNLSTGKEQPIWCYITFNGKRLRLSTQIKVLPADWNDTKQLIRGTSIDKQKQNQRLKNIRSKAETINNDYLIKDQILTESILKEELNKLIFPDKFTSTSAISNIYDFLIYFTEKNPKNIKESSMKSYFQLKPLLKDFAKIKGKAILNFESINSAWGDSFCKFLLLEKNHNINNADKHIKNIKALMTYSLKQELHNNAKFEFISRSKEETKEIYLTEDQIKEMYQLEVSEEYQKAKDIFVFSCLTAQRISDIKNLKKHNWKGDYIEIETKKTGEKLEIPLRKTAKEILKKYNGHLPVIVEQTYNKQLKFIAELMPSMHTEEIVYSSKGGVKTESTAYKYELVKSHTARRSFATNEYLAGTDPLFIRACTGHKTEKDFFNYIKVDQRQKVQKLKTIFDGREF